MDKELKQSDPMDKLIGAIRHCLGMRDSCRGCPYITATDCQRKIKRESLAFLLQVKERSNENAE